MSLAGICILAAGWFLALWMLVAVIRAEHRGDGVFRSREDDRWFKERD